MADIIIVDQTEDTSVIVVDQTEDIDINIEVSGEGPQGPTGPQGDPGPAGGAGFTLPTTTSIGGDRAVGTVGGYAVYADASTGVIAVGLSMAAVNGGEDVTIASGSKQTVTGAGWTEGQMIYLGVNGTLTQTPPSSGILQRVGIAHSSDVIIIEIAQPLTLI